MITNLEYAEKFMDLHRRMKNIQLKNVKYQNNLCSEKENTISQSSFVTLIVMEQLILLDHGCLEGNDIIGVGVSMNLISKELEVSPAMISKTVGILEKDGIVKRFIDESDRRGVKVYFTKKGFELFKSRKEKNMNFILSVFDEMGKDKTQEMLKLNEEFCEILESKFDARMQKQEEKENK